MNKSPFKISSPHRLSAARGQGLAEYAILIAIIGIITIFGLILVGGSVQGGFIKVCAALGNDGCEVVASETVVVGTVTPTLQVSVTPSSIPTATLVYVDPDPTRQPVSTIVAVEPTPTTGQLIMMRIKVVINGKGGGKSAEGIRVVIYNAAGEYVGEGVTDDKGNVSFSVPPGSYTIATLYNSVWQNDGPVAVTNSRENVVHR